MNAFRPYIWDPSLIIGQMVCMQAAFYSSETLLLILASAFGYPSETSDIFSTQVELKIVIVQLLSELICAVVLVRVVQRARQCLDFVCTFHLFHLIFVLVYNGAFPFKVFWWLLQLFGIAVCTVAGERLCRRYENQEIQLCQVPSKYDL